VAEIEDLSASNLQNLCDPTSPKPGPKRRSPLQRTSSFEALMRQAPAERFSPGPFHFRPIDRFGRARLLSSLFKLPRLRLGSAGASPSRENETTLVLPLVQGGVRGGSPTGDATPNRLSLSESWTFSTKGELYFARAGVRHFGRAKLLLSRHHHAARRQRRLPNL
jgi:hypothetical protein